MNHLLFGYLSDPVVCADRLSYHTDRLLTSSANYLMIFVYTDTTWSRAEYKEVAIND